jgi:hypothetical protein
VKSLSAGLTAAAAAASVVAVTLVKIEFPSGTVALNSSNWTFTVSGTTYTGANGLGSISPITDQGGELPGLQLELGWVSSSLLALALDDANEVQGAVVTISTLLLDATTYAQVGVVVDWIGYADRMDIAEDGDRCAVSLSCESKGVDLIRGNPLTYNDADQQLLYPGDLGFQYVTSQTDQPVVWPSREHFLR